MNDDVASAPDAATVSLARKFRAFLEGLSGEEIARYQASVGLVAEEAGVEGFVFRPDSVMTAPLLASVFQDVSANKATTADKESVAREKYIRG